MFQTDTVIYSTATAELLTATPRKLNLAQKKAWLHSIKADF